MNLDTFKYSKGEGDRNVLKKSSESTAFSAKEQISIPKVDLSSEYTKQEGQINVNILFILSGGEDRERKYFKMLLDDHNLKRIKVAFKSKKGQGLTPTQLLEVANESIINKKFTTDKETYRFEKNNGDIIYLLQDIDEFEEEIRYLATKEQPNCLRWIYSNPAFEIWLFYHHFDNPYTMLHDAIIKTPAERSQWLKQHLHTIINGGIQTTKEIAQIRVAINNSSDNYQEREGLPCLFSTRMHILANDILNTMGEEFDQMLERKAAFNKAMIEKFRKTIVKNIRYEGEKIQSLKKTFSEWAYRHPLMLPKIDDTNNENCYFDNRAFPLTYKIKKTYLDDNSDDYIPTNTDNLYLENIQNEIYRFYQILFVQNSSIASYTIDFSEIKTTIDLLGLDSQYAVLISFHLDTFDSLYGGDPIHKTDWGYLYKNIPLYKIRAKSRFMVIMKKEYLPKADFKQYESDNVEYEQIDNKNLIYSNIHRMKDLGDSYGLSVMRVVKFQLPPKGSFLFLKFNIMNYHKEKSELKELSKADVIKLQYQEGDFVLYKNRICKIIEILKNGDIKLTFVEKVVSFGEISPIRINGIEDADIYYDPIIAAYTVTQDEDIPTVVTNNLYYMDSFKNEIDEEGISLYDKVLELKFTYVHILQHWLIETKGQSGLNIRLK